MAVSKLCEILMNNFWDRFKSQPWLPLMQVALVANLMVAIIEYMLVWAETNSESFNRAFSLLFSPSVSMLWSVGAAVGFGALGVYIGERWRSGLTLNIASLWALVLCLLLGLYIKFWLIKFGLKFGIFIPTLWLELNRVSLVGIIIGVFWKGSSYWRYR